MTQEELAAVIEKAKKDRSTNLDLSRLSLAELPDSILNLPNLTSLSMCDFQGGELPEIVCNLVNLTSLDFTSSDRGGVTNEIPDNIANLLGNLVNLTSLNLYGVMPPNLEKIIDNLNPNLRALYIFNNSLETLPENIGNLKRLEFLDVSFNELASLPANFKNFADLTGLNLSTNRIQYLPDSIRYFSKITELDIECNLLTELPEWIGYLTEITELKLAENQIDKLPESINRLTKLTKLDLDGNSLIDLSLLQSLPALETVRMFGLELPRRYWMKFSNWNPEWLLDEENTEIRRVLIEQVGYEKIYEQLGAISIDSWREYHLMQIQADVDVEPIFLLKMTCPSTHHIHVLRVPPTMTSAEEAITWINHGIHPDDLAIQT